MTIRNLWVTASVGFLPPILFFGSMLLFTVAIISDQFASLARAIDWGSRLKLDDRLIEESIGVNRRPSTARHDAADCGHRRGIPGSVRNRNREASQRDARQRVRISNALFSVRKAYC